MYWAWMHTCSLPFRLKCNPTPRVMVNTLGRPTCVVLPLPKSVSGFKWKRDRSRLDSASDCLVCRYDNRGGAIRLRDECMKSIMVTIRCANECRQVVSADARLLLHNNINEYVFDRWGELANTHICKVLYYEELWRNFVSRFNIRI